MPPSRRSSSQSLPAQPFPIQPRRTASDHPQHALSPVLPPHHGQCSVPAAACSHATAATRCTSRKHDRAARIATLHLNAPSRAHIAVTRTRPARTRWVWEQEPRTGRAVRLAAISSSLDPWHRRVTPFKYHIPSKYLLPRYLEAFPLSPTRLRGLDLLGHLACRIIVGMSSSGRCRAYSLHPALGKSRDPPSS